MPDSPGAEHDFEFLPEVLPEANELDREVRIALAKLVTELHSDPYRGDLMDDRPPRILEGCRKVRFDAEGHRGKSRYRLIYRNEPSDGAVGRMVVLAIAEWRNMIAYAKAAGRLTKRLEEHGLHQVRRPRH